MHAVGDYIYKLRTRLNLSQREFGDRLGVAHSAISQWESGKTGNLKHTHLLRLAHLSGDTIEEILTGKQDVREDSGHYGDGSITREERVLLEKYRALDPGVRSRLQELIDTLDATAKHGHKEKSA